MTKVLNSGFLSALKGKGSFERFTGLEGHLFHSPPGPGLRPITPISSRGLGVMELINHRPLEVSNFMQKA